MVYCSAYLQGANPRVDLNFIRFLDGKAGEDLKQEIWRVVLDRDAIDRSHEAEAAREAVDLYDWKQAAFENPGYVPKDVLCVSLRGFENLSWLGAFRVCAARGHPCGLLREGLTDEEIDRYFFQGLGEEGEEEEGAEEGEAEAEEEEE